MKNIFCSCFLIAFFLSSCREHPAPTFNIIPDQCTINAGEELPISLKGTNIPASGKIVWTASKGEINPSTGISIIYTAPQEPGKIIITAELQAEDLRYSTALTCEIIAAQPVVLPTEPTTELPTPLPISPNPANTIAITEVMAVPCGKEENESYDEYIELYNYGDAAIDLKGWWITTSYGGKGTPDKIVSWNTRNSGITLGSNVLTDTTMIEPKQYAIVLSQSYYLGTRPYLFPSNTIVLTVAEGPRLGNETRGIKGTMVPIDTVVIYQGTNSIIDRVISTYGTPTYGSDPDSVTDNSRDRLPLQVEICHSVERISPTIPDAEGSWVIKKNGSPGSGY